MYFSLIASFDIIYAKKISYYGILNKRNRLNVHVADTHKKTPTQISGFLKFKN
jgi:hypothetical protein